MIIATSDDFEISFTAAINPYDVAIVTPAISFRALRA
jgi:hypothetical protein